MKFKDFSSEDLIKKIRALKKDVTCYPMWGTIFLSITPNQNKELLLEKEYKPNNKFTGTITEYHLKQRNNDEIVRKAEAKLRQNNFYGQHYDNNEASLKLHLSLNNIGDLDEKVVLGLIKLLIDEAESDKNGLKFHFKIIQPSYYTNDRFKDTDQLTLYFDKYSSLADMVGLAQKIEDYLSHNIPENQIKFGPKDSFGFNSFVSARFDTNKLLAEYNVYPFFDLELKKFFERHGQNELNNIPVGVLESVFNKIITSEQIINLGTKENKALSEADSQFIQEEFDRMLENPIDYLSSTEGGELVKEAQNKEKRQITSIKNKVYNLDLDFSSCKTEEEINEKFNAIKQELNEHTKSLRELQERSGKVDSITYNTVLDVIAQKDLQLQKAVAKILGKYTPPQLNPQAVEKFERLLVKIKNKANELTDATPLCKEKKQIASLLYESLNNEFKQYKSGETAFDEFKKNCSDHIDPVRHTLEIHQDGGWKELFVNILKTITSLGAVPLYNYHKSDGAYFFSKVKTDSIARVEKVEDAIDLLHEVRVFV